MTRFFERVTRALRLRNPDVFICWKAFPTSDTVEFRAQLGRYCGAVNHSAKTRALTPYWQYRRNLRAELEGLIEQLRENVRQKVFG